MTHLEHRRSMAPAKHACWRRWLFRAALLLLALAVPELAFAHGALRRAQPAKGAHLGTVPREIRLAFNENVELAVARIQLIGPDSAEIRLGTLALAADSPRVLVAAIGGALQAGEYTVAWQIAGADGHPVRGRYSFVIAPGAVGLAPPPSLPPAEQPAPAPHPDETHHNAATFPSGPGFDAESPLYVVVRWLTYIGLLGVLGALALRLVVLPAASRLGATALKAPAAARAAGIGLASAALVALAAVLRLYAQSYAMHGPAGAVDAGLVTTMLARTTWGWGWIIQAVGTVIALAGFVAARRSRVGWTLAALGGLALAVAPALSGHASAVPRLSGLAIVADAVHVLGAGGWVGGLFLLVAAGVPAAMRLPTEERGPAVAALVHAFSPVALVCAGALTVTGLFATWLHVGAPSALWQTDYGRTLLIKLALLTTVFGTGAYNWRRLRPALGDQAGAVRLRRSATVEIAAGVLVLLATAVLVATAAPAGL
jgi:putative copper export protein/methionine-rich copper-binding protein CopC